MPVALEREIKLRFDTVAAARDAVARTGATPLRPRRLQEDALLDTPDGQLRDQRSVLRVRRDPQGSSLTFKGPVEAGAMKVREELETPIADAPAVLAILERAGYPAWFRYQKFREEYGAPGVVVAIDETPVGVFIEIEGDETAVTAMAEAMGRGPADYVTESYRGLFLTARAERGLPIADMLFEAD